jgi:site-specific DNA recombinase
MRRAALYARVSTRRQKQEATIESQLAQLLTHAEEQGYELAAEHEFVDQAVSGKYLARPGLDRLRDAALVGAFEVLLCLSPDRLARSLGAQQVVLDELQRARIEVIFLNQPALGDSPQAQLLLNIQGAFAEYERLVISERMRRGRLYRLRQGQSVPYPAPYGYRYQPGSREQPSSWVVVPEQAARSCGTDVRVVYSAADHAGPTNAAAKRALYSWPGRESVVHEHGGAVATPTGL